MAKARITLGSDPEVFLVDRNNKAVMPLDVIANNDGIPVLKEYCVSYEIRQDGYKITEDGAAFELNVKPGSPKEVINNILAGLNNIEEIKPPDTKIKIHPIVDLNEYDVVRPELAVLGCSPDRVVGGIKLHRPEQDPATTFWRTGGGHIHFGTGFMEPPAAYAFIRACDTTLGLYDVCNSAGCLGDATQRRQMYGQAGRFRYQKWGLEYRTPSNLWLKNKDLMEEFLNLADNIGEAVDYLTEMVEYPLVVNIINSNNLSAARDALKFVSTKLGVSTSVVIGG